MKKFKELLFLNSIKRVAKKTIYNKYWNILEKSKDFDELVSQMSSIVSEVKIKDALEKSEIVHNQIMSQTDIDVITVFDDNYPKKLMVMENERPLYLFVKGNIDALEKQNIAVIGTRKPSSLSKKFENEMVKAILNTSDRAIVSGLALGCDKIAHQTTVDENKITIAVLPSGVNVISPASNKKLAENIVEKGGCLVSEYTPDVKANKGSYVNRDKIVAAFSDATFVVECGVKSGTMHTVDAAEKYKRQIYAYLPDDRLSGTYDGNEYILDNNKNAIKVEDIGDFLDDLQYLTVNNKSKSIQTKFE